MILILKICCFCFFSIIILCTVPIAISGVDDDNTTVGDSITELNDNLNSHESQNYPSPIVTTIVKTTIVNSPKGKRIIYNSGHNNSKTNSNYSAVCQSNHYHLIEDHLILFWTAIHKPQQPSHYNNNCFERQQSKGLFELLIASMDANYGYIVNELLVQHNDNYQKVYVWVLSIISACFVGVSSMFPLFLISLAEDNFITTKDSTANNHHLKYLLSFAVGGLLGDVFLHLIPEGWNQFVKSGVPTDEILKHLGFWILCGILTFGFMEMIFSHANAKVSNDNEQTHCNGHANGTAVQAKTMDISQRIDITGYLNLFANAVDNFSHGIALGASFLVNTKVGLLTTFAIILHEIPHEIGDFAILIKSGFNKWNALKAQMSIATVTVLGTVFTLLADSVDMIGTNTLWILPFISGGFLHIALTSLLPELMTETKLGQSIRHAAFIGIGISVMALVNLAEE